MSKEKQRDFLAGVRELYNGLRVRYVKGIHSVFPLKKEGRDTSNGEVVYEQSLLIHIAVLYAELVMICFNLCLLSC